MISLEALPDGSLALKSPTEVTTKDFGTTDAYADNTFWTNLFGGSLGMSHSGATVTPISALQASAVFACIRILTGDIGKLPLRLMKEGDDGIWLEDKKSPLARLLRKPNRRMTQHAFIVHIVMSLLLVGNAYVVVVRDGAGNPIELIPLIPTMVSIRETDNGELFYAVTSRLLEHGGPSKNIREEDMIHVRGLSLDGGIRGASPTQMASEVLGLAISTQQLAAMIFKNGANFQGVLTTDQQLSKESIEQTSRLWNERQSGVQNAYKTPVLSRGLTFQSIQQNAQETQLLETRRLMVEECARIFGVPLYKLSSQEKMGYASIDAQAQDYIDSTLIPLTNPIEQELAKILLFDRQFDSYKFSFDFSALEKGDLKTRTEHLHTLRTDGILSVNEVRRELNLPGIGPDGDIRTQPLNTGVVGDTSGLPNYQVNAPVKETENVAAPTAKKKSAKGGTQL